MVAFFVKKIFILRLFCFVMRRVRGEKSSSGFLVIIYLILGFYLINYGFNLFVIPKFFVAYDKWVLTAAGFALFVAAYRKMIYSKSAILKRFMRRNKY